MVSKNTRQNLLSLFLAGFLIFPSISKSQTYPTNKPANPERFWLNVDDATNIQNLRNAYSEFFTLGGGYGLVSNNVTKRRCKDYSEDLAIRTKVGYNQQKKELIIVSGTSEEDLLKFYTHRDFYAIMLSSDNSVTSKQEGLIVQPANKIVKRTELGDFVCEGPYCENMLKAADDIVFAAAKKLGFNQGQVASIIRFMEFDKYQKAQVEGMNNRLRAIIKNRSPYIYYFNGKQAPVDPTFHWYEKAHRVVIKTDKLPYTLILVSSMKKMIGPTEFFLGKKNDKEIKIGDVATVYQVEAIYFNQ